MTTPSKPLDVDQVTSRLHTRLIGRRLLYYPRLPSTNDEALRLAQTDEPEGTVIIADTQTAGRGRRGRRWQDEPGCCLLFSILLRPSAEPRLLPVLSLGVAAGVAEFLSAQYGLCIATKWPNDLLVGGHKVGGILLEQRGGAVVIGLGLNVQGPSDALQAKVPRPLTTLEEAGGRPFCREEVLTGIIEKVEDVYTQFQAGESQALVARYKKFESILGRQVRVTVGGESIMGRACGIASSGALLVDTEGGRREITAGEVELLTDLK